MVAEKVAGRTEGGAVDLIWINGENFASMKAQDLLFGPFVADLPNFRYVGTAGKPTTLVDFTVPTDGLEAPWGMAQFVFLYDTAAIASRRARSRSCSNGSRRTPAASPTGAADFIGSTFLKRPGRADRSSRGARATCGPGRLRRGHGAALGGSRRRVPPLAQGPLSALRPGAPSAAGRRRGRLLPGVQSGRSVGGDHRRSSARDGAHLHPRGGTIGNTHFVAIPFNAAHQAGAMVVADFLMSPEARRTSRIRGCGATARCSTSMLWRRRIAPASTRCRSASRRCRPTS